MCMRAASSKHRNLKNKLHLQMSLVVYLINLKEHIYFSTYDNPPIPGQLTLRGVSPAEKGETRQEQRCGQRQ